MKTYCLQRYESQNLVQQELSRVNINSLSLLDKTVQVTLQVMRMLGGLLEREVTRDDPE